MIHIIRGYSLDDRLTAAMFAERKRLFVDLLDWDVPVIDGRFEIDQFDDRDVVYLIASDGDGHLGSLRLLPTTLPHILSDLFPSLCDDAVPRGPAIYEITRLCLPRRLGAAGRLAVRNRLISAMVDHALEIGIAGFTGVVAWSFLEQVIAMGWEARALGRPSRIDSMLLGAFWIEIDSSTPERLAARGIYAPDTAAPRDVRQAA